MATKQSWVTLSFFVSSRREYASTASIKVSLDLATALGDNTYFLLHQAGSEFSEQDSLNLIEFIRASTYSRMVRLWVTCVTCVAFSVVRLAVAAVVRDGLVLEYAMPRNECVEAAFTDSGSNADVFGALRRDNVTTRCLDGIGVGGNTDDDGICVMSESDATALKAEFAAAQVAGADGLTIELWFTPRNPGQSSDRQPIFSIGNVNPDSTEDCDGTTAIRVTPPGVVFAKRRLRCKTLESKILLYRRGVRSPKGGMSSSRFENARELDREP